MKYFFYLSRLSVAILLLIPSLAHAQENHPLIPKPNKVVWQKGTLEWRPTQVNRAFQYDNKLGEIVKMALDAYQRAVGTPGNSTSKAIQLKKDSRIPSEGYRLEINSGGIRISAGDDGGFLYGVETLLMLAEDEQGELSSDSWVLPKVRIEDAPRFAYRGVHIDTSRHFFDIDFLKKQLDRMARLKINRFHWHFTDGPGWRPEIKKYPQLTRYTAYRPYENFNAFHKKGGRFCVADAPAAQGGFYTQDQMRDLVQYAAERNITVIPEIEMPGHSDEVTTVFPELSCTGKPYTTGSLCPGKEETFTFLQNVLDEIMEIFPSELIHIGGDEAIMTNWKSCPDCQRRMKEEGFKEVEQLQSYLIHRIEAYVNSKGRNIMGWDEILKGGLAPHATVMSWRDEEGGKFAVRSGQNTVMTPNQYLYFDYYQDAPATQPDAIGGYLPLEKVYGYDIPKDLTDKERANILGVQANHWSEYIPTPEHMEYMMYPRVLALAEIAWTQPEKKDYKEFHSRALAEVVKLQHAGYHPFELKDEVGRRPEALQPVQHLAKGAKVTYNIPFTRLPEPAKEKAMTDGRQGDWENNDGNWLGTQKAVDFVIDLGEVKPIQYVGATYLQSEARWIHLPSMVRYSISEDGKEYKILGEYTHDVPHEKRFALKEMAWEGKDQARFIRVEAKQSPRKWGWIFLDELIVR